ncbi:helix-turn-helix domain-containing protein [Streptomyces sp. NPDC056817]|uniref:helix-turn-helix domain-containing protein n=1 Tax=Streptomyces sp. NPDC056817 TaxID=3345950 RepID=UPI0036A7B892
MDFEHGRGSDIPSAAALPHPEYEKKDGGTRGVDGAAASGIGRPSVPCASAPPLRTAVCGRPSRAATARSSRAFAARPAEVRVVNGPVAHQGQLDTGVADGCHRAIPSHHGRERSNLPPGPAGPFPLVSPTRRRARRHGDTERAEGPLRGASPREAVCGASQVECCRGVQPMVTPRQRVRVRPREIRSVHASGARAGHGVRPRRSWMLQALGLGPAEEVIYTALLARPAASQELARQTGLEQAETARILLDLETRGLVAVATEAERGHLTRLTVRPASSPPATGSHRPRWPWPRSWSSSAMRCTRPRARSRCSSSSTAVPLCTPRAVSWRSS